MHNYFLKKQADIFHKIVVVGLFTTLLAGCTSRTEAPKFISQTNIGSLQANLKSQPGKPESQGLRLGANDFSQIDLEKETEIEKSCLQAWRNCLAGKSSDAIKQLKALSKRYPNSSSVMFMTGQVLERSGEKKEAIKYYENALHDSDFAVMSLYKLAESLRTTGDTKQAVIRYHELIKVSPQFVQAHLGLAKALIQAQPSAKENKKEAKEELKLVLSLEPENKEAKKLLETLQ